MLKIGIIGCGGIANQKHLPALSALKGRVELVAFCDLIIERAQKAAKEYGTPDAKTYVDYHDLLADKSIQVVHVCTPNVSHCEISVAAFEAGKHVFCEKPMAATASDAQKMMDAWKKSGKLFSIGYQNRYRPDSQTLKKLCDDGFFGDIYYARAIALRRRGVPTWGVFPDKSKQGGGPLIDIGTHSLDLTLWMMNNYEPASVMGASFQKLGRSLKKGEQGNMFGSWDENTYEVEDSAFGFVTMKNGAVISVEASWALNILDIGEAQTLICGTKAGADMRAGRSSLRINTIVADKQTTILPDTSEGQGVDFFSGSSADPKDVEADTWISAVEANDYNLLVVKPEQAFCVTRILDAIYRSAASGKLIEL